MNYHFKLYTTPLSKNIKMEMNTNSNNENLNQNLVENGGITKKNN